MRSHTDVSPATATLGLATPRHQLTEWNSQHIETQRPTTILSMRVRHQKLKVLATHGNHILQQGHTVERFSVCPMNKPIDARQQHQHTEARATLKTRPQRYQKRLCFQSLIVVSFFFSFLLSSLHLFSSPLRQATQRKHFECNQYWHKKHDVLRHTHHDIWPLMTQ